MKSLPDHIASAIEHDLLPVFRDERLLLIYDPWKREHIVQWSGGRIEHLDWSAIIERCRSRELAPGDVLGAYDFQLWGWSFSYRTMPGLTAMQLGTDDHVCLYWGEHHVARVARDEAPEFVLGLAIDRADEQSDQVSYWLPELPNYMRMPGFPGRQETAKWGCHGVYFDPVAEVFIEYHAEQGPEHEVKRSRDLRDLNAPKGGKSWARRIKYKKHGEHVFVFGPEDLRREQQVHRLTPGRQMRCETRSVADWLNDADSVPTSWLGRL